MRNGLYQGHLRSFPSFYGALFSRNFLECSMEFFMNPRDPYYWNISQNSQKRKFFMVSG